MDIIDEAQKIAQNFTFLTAPAGRIVEVNYFHPRTNSFETTPPVILTGERFGVAVYYENSGTEPFYSYIEVNIYSPDGKRTNYRSDPLLIYPAVPAVSTFLFQSRLPGIYLADIIYHAQPTEGGAYAPLDQIERLAVAGVEPSSQFQSASIKMAIAGGALAVGAMLLPWLVRKR